jgi:hypothetical protein
MIDQKKLADLRSLDAVTLMETFVNDHAYGTLGPFDPYYMPVHNAYLVRMRELIHGSQKPSPPEVLSSRPAVSSWPTHKQHH